MPRRSIVPSVRAWLIGELDFWQTEGIVSGDQSARIVDLYETQADDARRKRFLAVFALCGLAALMVGLSVLLLVGYNWSAMSASEKLAVLFGSLVASFGAASYLRFRRRLAFTSEIVFLLACILYGASIWLIGQIFNINAHYPDGLWFWALGTLPVVLCMNTPLLHALYAGLLAIWVGCEILDCNVFGRWLFHGWAYVPRSAYTLPLLVLPGLIWAYRRRSLTTIAVYIPVLAWWALLQPAAWQWEVDPTVFVGLAGALLLSAAQLHRVGDRRAAPYRIYGILLAGGALVPLSFADDLINWLRRGTAAENCAAGLTIAVIGAAAALGVVLFQQRNNADARRSFAGLLARQWFPLLLVAVLAGLCFWNGLFNQHGVACRDYAVEKWTVQVLVPAVIVNLMMLVLALWLMRVGLREDRTGPFTVGVLYFVFWAVLRYVDLFSGVGGMLGAALMFLLCGVGLFAVARFWQRRKDDLSSMEKAIGNEGETSPPSVSALTLPISQVETGPAPKIVLAGALCFQLAVLVGMIVLKAAPLWTGEVVLLRVAPVDPRELFRGDYVALNYDFSRVPDRELKNLPIRSSDRVGQTVFVPLKPEKDGRHWQAAGFSLKRPASGKYLEGVVTGGDRIQFGIESYYVQEGTGREFEQAAAGRQLSAEVSLASDGRALLRRLQFESPLPNSGPAYDPRNRWRWPTDRKYYACKLPEKNIRLDGRLDEPEWRQANVERHFVFPWKSDAAPRTEFLAFANDDFLYFAFRVEDPDVVALDRLRDKSDVASEDHVELIFCRDHQMKDYYCLEIDPRGRVNDFRGSYYRQFDPTWRCQGFEAVGTSTSKGYQIEGRIPRATLQQMAGSGDSVLFGLYRAEFSHDRTARPADPKSPPSVQKDWISWINPKTAEPDFHVPSSLGWLAIEP
ncbi:MAG: GDYXXLXY domain-containing protein [Thermoguttaceae bacterium]